MLPMKVYPCLSYRREINETDVNYTCNLPKVWDSSDSLKIKALKKHGVVGCVYHRELRLFSGRSVLTRAIIVQEPGATPPTIPDTPEHSKTHQNTSDTEPINKSKLAKTN